MTMRSSATLESVGLHLLERDWSFRPSGPADLHLRLARARGRLLGTRRAPASLAIRPVRPAAAWDAFFVYAPDGRLSSAQVFTLRRLKAFGRPMLVVCASPAVGQIPAALHEAADALYWKALNGYDFSAYAIILDEVAERSPGADLLVMNDSVLGPFADPRRQVEASPWDLTGFTAFAAVENHIQSYAFHVRNLTAGRRRAFSRTMPPGRSWNDYRDVIYLQESRMARLASRSLSVGALWYSDGRRANDPSLVAALDLLDCGFPFLKRSLLTRHVGLHDPARIQAALEERGHPLS